MTLAGSRTTTLGSLRATVVVYAAVRGWNACHTLIDVCVCSTCCNRGTTDIHNRDSPLVILDQHGELESNISVPIIIRSASVRTHTRSMLMLFVPRAALSHLGTYEPRRESFTDREKTWGDAPRAVQRRRVAHGAIMPRSLCAAEGAV